MWATVVVAALWAGPPERIAGSGVGNLLKVAPGLLCGAQPEGDAAFRELAGRGVQTIVSVDGAEPDVAAAKRAGLRYVHLPIGYDGVPAARAKELAKLLRETPGTIYVHCHHGKHRAPAAVAAAAVAAGLIAPADAEPLLKTAGTGAGYVGLWQAARAARPVAASELAALKVEYRERIAPPPVAAAMLKMEGRMAALKKLPRAADALLLKEDLVELARLPETTTRTAEYRALLEANRAAAEALDIDLRAGRPSLSALAAVAKSCEACHGACRDVPSAKR